MPGTTKEELARELVQYCARRDRVDELERVFGELLAGRRDKVAEDEQRRREEAEARRLAAEVTELSLEDPLITANSVPTVH